MKKNLAYNAAFNTCYRLLNVIFPLISATYVSRILSPAGIGKVAFAQNFLSYFLMFASLGLPEYGTREIAKRRNDPVSMNQLFTELLLINCLFTGVCSAIYCSVLPVLFRSEIKFYLILGLELFFNFFNIDWLYQGNEEYAYITIRSIAVKVLSLFALFLFVKEPSDYILYGLIHCLGIGLNNFFNIFHARKCVKLTWQGLNLRKHMPPILTLMASAIAASLYSKVDITMLGWLATEASVGYYTNAHKVVNIVLTLVTSLSAVFLPRLSYVYQNDKEGYSEYVTIGLKLILLLALPSFIGLILISQELTLIMFGVQFAPASTLIQILAIFTIVKGMGDILCYQVIISSGNEKKLILSRVVAGFANIILNAVLIPLYAHNGAAVASVVSELIVNGMILPYSLSITKPKINLRFLLSLLISSGVMAISVLFIKQFSIHIAFTLILSVLMGVMSYFVMLLLTKNDMVVFAITALRQRRRSSDS